MVALKVLLLYFGLFGTLAEKLPMVTDFVFDIVNYYQSKNIIFHISHEDIHPYTTRLMRKISLEGRYFTIYSINDCECNVTREIIDMHFVMLDSNVKCVECECQIPMLMITFLIASDIDKDFTENHGFSTQILVFKMCLMN